MLVLDPSSMEDGSEELKTRGKKNLLGSYCKQVGRYS